MGACIPVEHGGAGAEFLSYVLALEELARADAGVAVTVAVHTSAATLPLIEYASSEQVHQLVPPLAGGQALGAFALTEPRAGSDAASLQTRATSGRITGAKQFITTGAHADTLVVFARDTDGSASGRISAYVVHGGSPGMVVARVEEKMGLDSSSTASLTFDETPGERLGHAGQGMRVALRTLACGRIGIAAQAVGIAQAALEVASRIRQGAPGVRPPDRSLSSDPA